MADHMEAAMQAIWAVERSAPDVQTARERLWQIEREAGFRAKNPEPDVVKQREAGDG